MKAQCLITLEHLDHSVDSSDSPLYLRPRASNVVHSAASIPVVGEDRGVCQEVGLVESLQELGRRSLEGGVVDVVEVSGHELVREQTERAERTRADGRRVDRPESPPDAVSPRDNDPLPVLVQSHQLVSGGEVPPHGLWVVQSSSGRTRAEQQTSRGGERAHRPLQSKAQD